MAEKMIDNDSNDWSNNPILNEQMNNLLGSPKGYFSVADEINTSKRPVTDQNDRSDEFRNIVFAWIREDAPLTVKMTLTKEHVDSLVNRLLRIAE